MRHTPQTRVYAFSRDGRGGVFAMRNRQRFCAYVLTEQFDHACIYRTERGTKDFILRWRKELTPLIEFWELLSGETWPKHKHGVSQRGRGYLNTNNKNLMPVSNAALEGNNARVRCMSSMMRRSGGSTSRHPNA